jgi:hypothetical protein
MRWIEVPIWVLAPLNLFLSVYMVRKSRKLTKATKALNDLMAFHRQVKAHEERRDKWPAN